MIADDCKALRLQLEQVTKAKLNEQTVHQLNERRTDLLELKEKVVAAVVSLQALAKRTTIIGKLDATKAVDRIQKLRADDAPPFPDAGDLAAVDASGLDRRKLAKRGTQAVLRMVLEEGFFHADPHPGNVFYLPGNGLAFIDFGMVGRLTPGRRHQLVDLLYGLARRESEPVADLLVQWAGEGRIDVDALAQDVSAFVDQFHGMPLEQIRLARLLGELTAIMREHHIALPPDLALLFKAVISLEGLGRILDPGFDLVREATPFLQRAAAERMSPAALARQGAKGMEEMLKLLGLLPDGLRRLLRLVRRGGPAVTIDIPALDDFADRLDRSASRLTMGVVTAALIIGSSIVMTVGGNNGWFGPSLLGVTGFIAALACGIWLVLSVRRSGRRA